VFLLNLKEVVNLNIKKYQQLNSKQKFMFFSVFPLGRGHALSHS
jgi:hypothetical protein